MNLPDVDLVCQRLADAAKAVKGLRASPFPEDAVEPPLFAVVGPESIDYVTMVRAVSAVTFVGMVYTSRGSTRAGWKALRSYQATSGPTSLRAALEADQTLGGACSTMQVAGWAEPGQYEVAGVAYLGARLNIQVWG